MRIALIASFTAASLALSPATFAQAPQGPTTGLNAAMTKLFGDHSAFSARAEMQVEGGAAGGTTLIMDLAVLDGQMRSDLDMSTMKSAQMPPNAVQAMKQMGMDRIASIVNQNAGTLCLIYPGLNSYAEMPLPAAEAAAAKDPFQMQKTELGRETIGGRATTKYKVTLTDSQGVQQEALIWTAPDLNHFPVRMQMTDKGSTITVNYTDVKLTKPEAALFRPPAEFTRHANVQALMQAAMMRMMSDQGGPKGKGAPKGK
jgi:predicted aspartyl protease